MPWYEKLDIVLFTYSLPLTGLFAAYVLMNVIIFPLIGYTLVLPLWMLVPTVLFLIAPVLNDVIFHWRSTAKRELAIYIVQSTLLFGSMFFVSLRASTKALFGGSTFLVTPKHDQHVGFRHAWTANRIEWLLAVGLTVAVFFISGSVLSVLFLVIPALFMSFMSVLHQADK